MKQCDEVDWKIEFESKKTDILELIRSFSKPEEVDDSNLFYCSQCKEHTKITKTMSIYNTPPYLIIHMKKLKMGGFSYSSGSSYLEIDFPLKGLDLTEEVISKQTIGAVEVEKSDFATENMAKLADAVMPVRHQPTSGRLVYDCVGVINHSGGQYSGHYTAYSKVHETWYYFNDESVRQVDDLSEIVSERAYVLFYKLRM